RQNLVVRRREPDIHFRSKVGARVGVRLSRAREMQVIATGLDKLNYFAAPPSEADNGSLYLIDGIFHGAAASPEPRWAAISEAPAHSTALLGFCNVADREREYARSGKPWSRRIASTVPRIRPDTSPLPTQHCAKSHRVANTLPPVLGGETAKKAKLIKPIWRALAERCLAARKMFPSGCPDWERAGTHKDRHGSAARIANGARRRSRCGGNVSDERL